jgi:hypothetical protein
VCHLSYLSTRGGEIVKFVRPKDEAEKHLQVLPLFSMAILF